MSKKKPSWHTHKNTVTCHRDTRIRLRKSCTDPCTKTLTLVVKTSCRIQTRKKKSSCHTQKLLALVNDTEDWASVNLSVSPEQRYLVQWQTEIIRVQTSKKKTSCHTHKITFRCRTHTRMRHLNSSTDPCTKTLASVVKTSCTIQTSNKKASCHTHKINACATDVEGWAFVRINEF
jgi:hypothetical protein